MESTLYLRDMRQSATSVYCILSPSLMRVILLRMQVVLYMVSIRQVLMVPRLSCWLLLAISVRQLVLYGRSVTESYSGLARNG